MTENYIEIAKKKLLEKRHDEAFSDYDYNITVKSLCRIAKEALENKIELGDSKDPMELEKARNNLEAVTLNCAAQFIVSAFHRFNMDWDGEMIEKLLAKEKG